MQIVGRHSAQWLFFGVLYLVDIRLVKIGGGTSSPSLIDIYGSALAWSVGASMNSATQLLACIAAVGVLGWALQRLFRERRELAAFFAVTIVVMPVVLVVARGSDVVYVRHFLLAMSFLLLAASFFVGELWQRGSRGRLMAAMLLVVYLTMNVRSILTFFEDGRGHYKDAIEFISESPTQSSRVILAGDQDYRVLLLLDFYAPRIKSERTIEFRTSDEWPSEGVDVVVLQRDSVQSLTDQPDRIGDKFGNQYSLARSFRAAPLAGLDWNVYRRVSK